MTSRERAERFFDAELTSTGSSNNQWSVRLKTHLAAEFDAVAQEAAEQMRERCAVKLESMRCAMGFGCGGGEELCAKDATLDRLSAAIRALPLTEEENKP